MDTDYERKFEEMRKYIPFLDSVIERLESAGTTAQNPRQPLLVKFRSLRGLLSTNKKRMKMDNLLKCERVLINLHRRLKQKDSYLDLNSDTDATFDTNIVQNRNLRKNLSCEGDNVYLLGSKESVLYQMRPNKSSTVPIPCSAPESHKSKGASSKQSYTRVLVSPERCPGSSRDSPLTSTNLHKPFHNRRTSPQRSPSKSPLKHSPTYNKNRRKLKSGNSQKPSSKHVNNLNIILKIPEESLSSLNTEDITSMIINCSDDTLQGFKSQILSELKQMGTNNDISDLILKSYQNKKRKNKRREEIEEGELPDSGSDCNESIYSSLVTVDKDCGSGKIEEDQKVSGKEQESQKIQIRLVVKSKKEGNSESGTFNVSPSHTTPFDQSDFEQLQSGEETNTVNNKVKELKELKDTKKDLCVQIDDNQTSEKRKGQENVSHQEKVTISKASDQRLTLVDHLKSCDVQTEKIPESKIRTKIQTSQVLVKEKKACEMSGNKTCTANFYIENNDIGNEEANSSKYNSSNYSNKSESNTNSAIQLLNSNAFSGDSIGSTPSLNDNPKFVNNENVGNGCSVNRRNSEEIPLLDQEATNKREIRVLKDMKKEIFNENISRANPEINPPPLHQRKLTKIEDTHTMLPKEQISEEDYIENAKRTVSLDDFKCNTPNNQVLKKPSLKLTQKEYERFNLFGKLEIDYSSDEEDKWKISPVSDVYANLVPNSPDFENDKGNVSPVTDSYSKLAPKSPDREDFNQIAIKPPVIIPADPVKTAIDSSTTDVDMRVIPGLSSSNSSNVRSGTLPLSVSLNFPKTEADLNISDKRLPLVDPRMRRNLNYSNTQDSLSPKLGFAECSPRAVNFPPIITPIVMPNSISNMTPNRIIQTSNIIPSMVPNVTTDANAYEISSFSAQSFGGSDCYSRQGHVHTLFPNHIDYVQIRDDVRNKNEFSNMYVENNNSSIHNLSDCLQTPVQPFGVSDGPPNSSHTFARLDKPMKPNYGPPEATMTSVYPFGRPEFPSTSQVRRTENLMTPTPPFGKTDFPQNLSQISPIRYSNLQEPRKDRSFDLGNHSRYSDEQSYDNYKEHMSSHLNPRYYKYDVSKRNDHDSYRNYSRYKSAGRHDYRNVSYEQEAPCGSSGHDSRAGHWAQSNKVDRHYHNDRSKGHRQKNYRCGADGVRRYYDPYRLRRNYKKEHSIDRKFPEQKRDDKEGKNCLNVKTVPSHLDSTTNRSFQDSFTNTGNTNLSESNFDARRKRASSVGRVLSREPIVESKFSGVEDKISLRPQGNFRRACSVGRESVNYNSTKNLSDIKKELQAFKNSGVGRTFNTNDDSVQRSTGVSKKGNERDPRLSRRYNHDVQNSNNSSHLTPRQEHLRESKLHHDVNKDYQKKNYDLKTETSQEIKKHGIVYSADNIAKGTFLGLSYGVKNYKIPKIKKPSEKPNNDQVIEEDNITTLSAKMTNNTCEKKIYAENQVVTPLNQEFSGVQVEISLDTEKKKEFAELEIVEDENKDKNETINLNTCKNKEKGVTRSAGLCNLTEKAAELSKHPQTKLNKRKKSILQVSDSDDEDDIPVINLYKNSHKEASKENETSTELASTVDEHTNTLNIDQEGGATVNSVTIKTHEPESSGNPVSNKDNSMASDNCLGMELEMFPENVDTDSEIENVNDLIANLDDDLETSKNDGLKNPFTKEIKLENLSEKIPCVEKKDYDTTKDHKLENNQKSTISIGLESFPLPDSTVDIDTDIHAAADNVKVNDEVPDSTEGLTSQMNSDLTSSDTSRELGAIKTRSEEFQQQNDSIGGLLSLLKDKSKMNELLSMLKDRSSENETLKKLQLLSEIVSNDNYDEKANVSNLSHTPSTSMNKGDDGENEESKVSDVNDLTKDHFVNNGNKIINIQEEQEFDSVNNDENLNSTLSCQLDNLEGENFEEKGDSESKQTAHFPEESSQNESKKMEEKKSEDVCVKSIKSKEAEACEIILKENEVLGKNKGESMNNKVDETTISKAIDVEIEQLPKVKRTSRELKKLHEDIKEMFTNDDFVNVTGIRMCRLAKLANYKLDNGEQPNADNTSPVTNDRTLKDKNPKRKCVSKNKVSQKNPSIDMERIIKKCLPEPKVATKCKPGPRSKTKPLQQCEADPYLFESTSVSESHHMNESESKLDSTLEFECDSLGSSKNFESMEQMSKPNNKFKRKRRGWQFVVIKPQQKKMKVDMGNCEKESSDFENHPQEDLGSSDTTCFTDKTYCFTKDVAYYSCKFCSYVGDEIVHHYKKQHPHLEIPLSRMSPDIAKEAIEQSEEMLNIEMSKVGSYKSVCRFCFKEVTYRKLHLEAFFWHVVSAHTGEYKQNCSACKDAKKCRFQLDIPPPPKESEGQLLGYICGKCNFTQISLENLKSHVITRHNNEQVEVTLINMAVIPKELLSRMKACLKLRTSTRIGGIKAKEVDHNTDGEIFSDKSLTSKSSCNRMKSQITLENKDGDYEGHELNRTLAIKFESKKEISAENSSSLEQTISSQSEQQSSVEEPTVTTEAASVIYEGASNDCNQTAPNDVLNYPHFKIRYTGVGTKEYVCCINGAENHFTSVLLISFKKHVQIKHNEKWDGFCFICKLRVTPHGDHYFKDCLKHYLDEHMDEFPQFEKEDEYVVVEKQDANRRKHYLKVKPLSKLIRQSPSPPLEPALPVIGSVFSLRVPPESAPASASHVRDVSGNGLNDKNKVIQCEEAQAQIMSKKHNLVLDIMMNREKLVNLFKCAGRFCSYSSDDAEDALCHALAHERKGGENSLLCAYCGFDSLNSSVELVTHVFKIHGGCRYACAHCFYRAAAIQLVRAHSLRKHPQFSASSPDHCLVLCNTVAPPPIVTHTPLPREQAVPLYRCNQVVSEEKCKFKTYELNSYRAHYRSKHAADEEYSCHCCPLRVPEYEDLLQHMKCHGFKLYQCTWCVHGADDESELLTHASEEHPDKQPSAYLRVITYKEGQTPHGVLPLTQFNLSEVETVVIKPNIVKGDPEKDAENSFVLEKIISQKTRIVPESQAPPRRSVDNDADSEVVSEPFDSEPLAQNQDSSAMTLHSLVEEKQESAIKSSADFHSHTQVLIEQYSENNVCEQISPKKINENETVCLESDDVLSMQIVDLSDDDPSLTDEHISQVPGCTKAEVMNCNFQNGVKETGHYMCSLCDAKYVHFGYAEKHNIKCHNSAATLIYVTIGKHQSVVTKNKKASKRKKLVERDNQTTQPAPKVKKFGPNDINLLPVNPILDDLVYCALCEFNSKVRLNMVRHLQLHAEQQPVPQTAPVNPVPHLETNEKHFDKMINLASSSLATRVDKCLPQAGASFSLVPPETAARYPKYVPDQQRYTCPASGCCYISVSEQMLKYHWDTLHSDIIDFSCVHCLLYQHSNTSKKVTSWRIIDHLKMHHVRLYACSCCPFYHHRRPVVQKHIVEYHNSGDVIVIREESTVPIPKAISTSTTTPTMDLKPWQCGVCNFKSMLRKEVVEHCSKIHKSKMQYKCMYCDFRASVFESVQDHQKNVHPNRPLETFYYYYREGSIPNEPDGVPLWQKQYQNIEAETRVKSETNESTEPKLQSDPTRTDPPPQMEFSIDLNVVKQDPDAVAEPDAVAISEELQPELFRSQLCSPFGLKYKCPLCKIVYEESREVMLFHLYEELQYRKWQCGICSYKAFHKNGLNEHMLTEHRKHCDPIRLPLDRRVETWITEALDHQSQLIEEAKRNLAQDGAAEPVKEYSINDPENSAEVPHHSSAQDNSLLVVRYEETIPTPEVLASNLRPSSSLDTDEDEERLVIDELSQNISSQCSFCMSVCNDKDFRNHIMYVHGNIKPYFCGYCDFNGYKKRVLDHVAAVHGEKPVRVLTKAQRSRGPPLSFDASDEALAQSPVEEDSSTLMCLGCERFFTEYQASSHLHEYGKPAFAKIGHVVVKCCICLRLHGTVEEATAHHSACHPTESLNYTHGNLRPTKQIHFCCSYCEHRFKFWKDAYAHWKSRHSSFWPFKFSKRRLASVSGGTEVSLTDRGEAKLEGKSDGAAAVVARKMPARKPTSKLLSKSVARKSTSRLPHHVASELRRPSAYSLDDASTSVTFNCTDVAASLKDFGEVMNINPTVLVQKIQR